MISVNEKLDKFPFILKKIKKLEKSNLLEYLEVNDWFKISAEYTSPEGHLWGIKAHSIIGRELAKFFAKEYSNANLGN